ncbi:hypothetical protein [Ciceribacter sp. RN22]|uniref:hypothetical protein n=1 Tax=Ciceribacter sp. RN22 TaxID=2954932 RepID=UPI00209269F2|nr:hypothetical protein [Ciceribacter sp. RN22]MCO6179568.1 hypothetical protein [Ciceribacter sp. RN22]
MTKQIDYIANELATLLDLTKLQKEERLAHLIGLALSEAKAEKTRRTERRQPDEASER